MKVLCAAYRDWARDIYHSINNPAGDTFYLAESPEELEKKLEEVNPDLVLTWGWSEIIPKEQVEKYRFVCLHPAPLPKYRGGSPIQNQIVRGVKDSAVTMFYMDEKIDHGPIINQTYLSLDGHLDKIFERITRAGIKLTNEILAGKTEAKPQDHSMATYFKRRKPEQSEFTYGFLRNSPGQQVFDFMRALEDPYPNPFFVAKDGGRLLIKDTHLIESRLDDNVTPSPWEIKLKSFKDLTAEELHEKIESMDKPYLVCADGKRLHILETDYEETTS